MRFSPIRCAIVFLVSLAAGSPVEAQPVDQMCGDGTTFTVDLPASGGTVGADSVTLPNGCRIYALLVSGYARNPNFDELTFYKLAKFVMENNGYVHWAWWNNLLKEYMARPLHRDTFTRPLTGEVLESTPGGLTGVHAAGFVPPSIVDVVPKAIPEEDRQFQADASRMLAAIRLHNPNAIIIVAGHSMGGESVARLGANTSVSIDLLAPIDPVGNRSTPVGQANERTYNWTRWRAAQETFRGFRQADCVRNPSAPALCQDFDDRLFFKEYRCTAVGPYLDSPPAIPSRAPGICPGPVAHSGTRRRFGPNIRRLYHRWQKEAVFPFDFQADERFGHPEPLNALVDVTGPFNLQRPVVENVAGERNRDKTCSVGLDPRDNDRLCNDGDGHGEIVGFRSPTPGEPNVGPLSDNTPVAPLALRARNWPAVSAAGNRRQKLIEMVSADDSWPHRPLDPDLCMVSDDLVLIARALVNAQAPPPSPDDTTGPVTTAFAEPDANAHGWHNDDVVMTLRAADEPGGSGVAEVEWALTGAHVSSEIVAGDTAEVLLSAESATRATFFARDQAGNAGTTSTLDFMIDKTPPAIAAIVEGGVTPDGWSNTDVTVRFTATDALSGVAFVSDPVRVTTEGANQEITGGAHDVADNESTASAIVSIDKTPPSLSAVLSSLPNANGWHKRDVVVTFTAADALSGVASVTPPVSIATEGSHEVVGMAIDRAGNLTTTTVVVRLDKSAPEAVLSFDPKSRKIVVVGRDVLSGVAAGPIQPTFIPSVRSRKAHRKHPPHWSYRVEDAAGNSLVLTLDTKRFGFHRQVEIRTLAYNSGTPSNAPENVALFEWTRKGDTLKALNQAVEVKRSRAYGWFTHKSHATLFKSFEGARVEMHTVKGLALIRLVTSNGKLKIEVP